MLVMSHLYPCYWVVTVAYTPMDLPWFTLKHVGSVERQSVERATEAVPITHYCQNPFVLVV